MISFQNRSVSMVDMYIDSSEPSENVGQIHFSLEYDFQNTTLILKVIQVSKQKMKMKRIKIEEKILQISPLRFIHENISSSSSAASQSGVA